MIILRMIRKIFGRLCRSNGNLSTGIDSHRWESKVEITRSLSSKRS